MNIDRDLVLERLVDIGIIPSSVFKTSNGQFVVKVSMKNKGFFKVSKSYLYDWIGCIATIIWKFSTRELPYAVIIFGWRTGYATI